MTSIELEQRRIAAVQNLDALGSSSRSELQEIVDLAAAMCHASASLNIFTAHEQHCVATAGIEPMVTRRGDSICAHVLDVPEVVVVTDAAADERLRSSPFVDGRLASVRLYASAPLVTEDGTTIGRLCVFDDQPRTLDVICERLLAMMAARAVDVLEVRMRRDRERSLAGSEDLAKARSDEAHAKLVLFAGQMGHDMRVPLATIKASAELLGELPSLRTDLTAQRLLRGTTRSVDRAERMIDAVLAYAKSAGTIHPVDLDLAGLVEEVLDDMQPVLDAAGAEIVVRDLPRVFADADQVYSVVLNLVANAVKFARPGVPPLIAVTSTRHGSWSRIFVTDNGSGVAEDQRRMIFEPFARGDNVVAGSGLGLATAKQVIEAHGGRIGVGQGRAGGSEFWFELPMGAPEIPVMRGTQD